MADQYDKRFDGWEITCLKNAKVTPEEANLYDRRFNGWDIDCLKSYGISPEKASTYPENFAVFAIIKMEKIINSEEETIS